MKRAFVCGLVSAGALMAQAHVAPMFPIEMDVRCDGDQLRLEIDAAAWEWVEDVLNLRKLPSEEWKGVFLNKSERFINDHFQLSTQGLSIPGRVLGGRVVQQPWQSPASARVRIRVVYDLPSGGDVLKGKAFFFKSEWDLHEGAGKPVEGLVRRFETILTLRGPRAKVMTVPIQQPDFSLELKDLRRSSLQRWGESLWRGGSFRGALFLWGLLLGLAVLKNPNPALWAGIGYAGGLLAAALIKPTHFPWEWLGSLLGAGLILFETKNRWLPWAMALVSGAIIGAGVAAAGKSVGADLGFDRLAIPFFAAGALFPVLLGALPGAFLPWVSERMAAARGSDRGPEQRETLRKTLAAVIAGVSLVWLIRGLHP
jgi:hypothetical protein